MCGELGFYLADFLSGMAEDFATGAVWIYLYARRQF